MTVSARAVRPSHFPAILVLGFVLLAAGLARADDYVVVRAQPTADSGDIVVAGIPGEEATVKTLLRKRNKVVLRPANAAMVDLLFRPDEVTIYGKVVSLIRRY